MLPAEQAQHYLAAGNTVISIDYRFAPETKLPAIREDLPTVLQDVAYRGVGGPVIAGSSFGDLSEQR
jgi:acetyl esterase/lipase